MKKSKFLVLSLAATMLMACGGSSSGDITVDFKELPETDIGTKTTVDADKKAAYTAQNPLKIALVTDSGTLNDHNFNESTWNGVNEFAHENGGGEITTNGVSTGTIQTKYYQPTKVDNDYTTATRLEAMKSAVNDGAKVLVLPGYLFQSAIARALEDEKTFGNTYILALDCVTEDNDNNYKAYTYTDKITSVIYREEQSGFLAGYGAVKEGLRNLGFVGGMAVPAVVRYGSGFVQGANKAAEELSLKKDEVKMQYYYAGAFAATDKATTYSKTWYKNGTEAIFACGGAVYQSVIAGLAENKGKKWIGVDTNQHADTTNLTKDQIDACLTSAMKNLTSSTKVMLASWMNEGSKWKDGFAGKVLTAGAKSGNTVLATPEETGDTTCWNFDHFKLEDYKEILGKLKDGTVKVNSNSDNDQLSTHNFGASLVKVNYIAA